MILTKYDINGETYVKLDELNDLMKSERRNCMKEAKLAHVAGDSDKKMRFVFEHGAILDLGRKVNMSENGEKHLIFTRDEDGKWEFLVDVVRWDDLPEYMRKAVAKAKAEWVTISTSEIDEATLYDSFEEAEAELRRVVEKTEAEAWHITKKWMFDTKENREGLLTLFYDGGEESDSSDCHGRDRTEKHDKKAEAIQQAEDAIERTRAALDRTEKLLTKVKDGEDGKPSEAPQEPPMRTVMNRKGAKRCPARYTVWYRDDGETTQHCMGFVRFESGIPVFTNRPCKATWFVWRDMAEKVAEKCGDGFEVVDMINQMTKEERLLRAIFSEDGMDGDDEPEYHGDGTRAEDEDWDGDD